MKIIVCNIEKMFHCSGTVAVIVVGHHHGPGIIYVWFQIVAVQIVKGAENVKIVFWNEGISDIIGYQTLDSFLIAAGHDNAGGNLSLFKYGFINSSNPLSLVANDERSIIEFGNVYIGKTFLRGLAVAMILDIIVLGCQKYHPAL